TTRRNGGGKLSRQNKYVLPRVPGKKEFVTTPQTSNETTVSAFSAETPVKPVTNTIFFAPDLAAHQNPSIPDGVSRSIPFNPLRGDEMEIKNATLLKPVNPATPSNAPITHVNPAPANQSFLSMLSDRTNAPVLVLAGLLVFVFILFLAFLFGPMR